MSEQFKYIAVYNWGKYQERMKNGSIKRPFVRDAVHKDSDGDYSQLTCLQRYVLDGCRRLIGLHGRNLNNDPVWIGRALCVDPLERKYVSRAIHLLTIRGLVLLTNERDPFSKSLNGMERNGMEGKENDSTRPPAEPGEQEKIYQICDEWGSLPRNASAWPYRSRKLLK